jgi:hypothetical protein
MKRKTLLAITIVLFVIVLSPVFYYFWYVPHVLGEQYLSVSWSPIFYGSPGRPNLHLVYEGMSINVTRLLIEINVTNSYFQPIYISYNGFDVVWLIYNQTVSDPSDVISNKNHLVWGAYFYRILFTMSGDNQDFTGNGFQFYSDHREVMDIQVSIPSGGLQPHNYAIFAGDLESGWWAGQYCFNTDLPVPLGTYFMYCIIFGVLCPAQNVTVISVGPF